MPFPDPASPDPRRAPGDDSPSDSASSQQPRSEDVPSPGEERRSQVPLLLGSSGAEPGRGPSALDLVRLSARPGMPRGREEVYRHIARLAELQAGQEFLVVPCQRGEEARFLSELTEAAGSGVDPDPELIEAAVEVARNAGLASRLHFDPASPLDLPYKDDVFDLSIGEIGLSATTDPAAAVAELVRVTKPMGVVALIQPFWTQKVEGRRQDVLVRRLGMRPALLQQWKQMLRSAGVVELHVEDLSEAAGSRGGALPATGLGEFLAVRDRVSVLWKAWKRWRWQGVSAAFGRESEVRRLVTHERLLGLALVKGVKWVSE